MGVQGTQPWGPLLYTPRVSLVYDSSWDSVPQSLPLCVIWYSALQRLTVISLSKHGLCQTDFLLGLSQYTSVILTGWRGSPWSRYTDIWPVKAPSFIKNMAVFVIDAFDKSPCLAVDRKYAAPTPPPLLSSSESSVVIIIIISEKLLWNNQDGLR